MTWTVTLHEAKEKGSDPFSVEKTINKWAGHGWEFVGLETFTVEVPSGCLAALVGAKNERVAYYVAVFRKPIRSRDTSAPPI